MRVVFVTSRGPEAEGAVLIVMTPGAFIERGGPFSKLTATTANFPGDVLQPTELESIRSDYSPEIVGRRDACAVLIRHSKLMTKR